MKKKLLIFVLTLSILANIALVVIGEFKGVRFLNHREAGMEAPKRADDAPGPMEAIMTGIAVKHLEARGIRHDPTYEPLSGFSSDGTYDCRFSLDANYFDHDVMVSLSAVGELISISGAIKDSQLFHRPDARNVYASELVEKFLDAQKIPHGTAFPDLATIEKKLRLVVLQRRRKSVRRALW